MYTVRCSVPEWGDEARAGTADLICAGCLHFLNAVAGEGGDNRGWSGRRVGDGYWNGEQRHYIKDPEIRGGVRRCSRNECSFKVYCRTNSEVLADTRITSGRVS